MRKATSAIAVLLLAACSGQSGNEQAAGNGAAAAGEGRGAAGSDGVTLQAGEWETRVEVVRMNIPNMPAGMTPPMPAAMTTRTCLTPEQVGQPNASFFTGGGEAAGCTYENFSMEGGRIQGAVQCHISGTTTRTTMNGQFTPTSYEMNSQVEATVGGMTTEQETRITAQRIGDCPAG